MKYYELSCNTYLKNSIHFRESFDALSKFINYSICQIPDYKTLHNQNSFKHYCFSSFHKPEKDGIYKQDKTYTFTLRGFNRDFIEQLSSSLRLNINNPQLQVLTTKQKTVHKFFINELYSITPAINTIDEGNGTTSSWSLQQNADVMQLTKQLHENLLKKYQSFYDANLEAQQNFIQLLAIKNQKPMLITFIKKFKTNTKKIQLLGNKFHIHVNEDEISQKLAFLALGCGLGEKQSYGGGFCQCN